MAGRKEEPLGELRRDRMCCRNCLISPKRAYRKTRKHVGQVIVIADGSHDDTAEAAGAAGAKVTLSVSASGE